MKLKKNKLYHILLVVFLTTSIISCKDDDDNGTAPGGSITELSSANDFGEVILKWKNPDDPNLYYVDITYTDSKGKERSRKVSKFNTDKTTEFIIDTIRGFTDTKEYTFTLTLCNSEGAKGESTRITQIPGLPAFDMVMNTVTFKPDFGGAKITWQNVTNKETYIDVVYQDPVTNKFMISSFNATENGYGFVSGLKDTEVNFTLKSRDSQYNYSEDKNMNLTPLTESNIPKSLWSIPGYDANSNSEQIGYSSQELSEGATPNGRVAAIFDNNPSTFWHARYNSPSSNYPHWIVIDLGQEVTISRVEVVRRQDDARGQTGHQFYTCLASGVADQNDQKTWTWVDQGKFDFDPSIDDPQSARLENNPVARYLKIYIPAEFKGLNDFAMIGETNVFGQLD